MSFDIHQLEDLDFAEDEDALYEYQDELLNLFANSPEGQSRAKEDPGMAFWARVLIDYGFSYTGATIPQMTEDNVEELLTDIFPRKVSLSAPEDADGGIPSLFTMGKNAGFDMTDEEDSAAFINLWNANLRLSGQNDPLRALGTGDDIDNDLLRKLEIGGEKRKADPKAKRRRKLARESRKRNRKRK